MNRRQFLISPIALWLSKIGNYKHMAKREFSLSPGDGSLIVTLDFNPDAIFILNPTIYPLYASVGNVLPGIDSSDYTILPGQSVNLPIKSRDFGFIFQPLSNVLVSPKALIIFYTKDESVSFATNTTIPQAPYEIEGDEITDSLASGSSFNTHELITLTNHQLGKLKSLYFWGSFNHYLFEFQLWVASRNVLSWTTNINDDIVIPLDMIIPPGEDVWVYVFNQTGALRTYEIVWGMEVYAT